MWLHSQLVSRRRSILATSTHRAPLSPPHPLSIVCFSFLVNLSSLHSAVLLSLSATCSKGRNCGSSGCLTSFCGNPEKGGECPQGFKCLEDPAYGIVGTCCKPDCRGRGCGSSCGVSCGTCPSGHTCNAYNQCVNPSIAPNALPSMLPAATISTTTGGDKFAAFIGGAIATGLIGVGISYFARLKERL
jgi:hypothetical protein